jgi:hypothetical protein
MASERMAYPMRYGYSLVSSPTFVGPYHTTMQAPTLKPQ